VGDDAKISYVADGMQYPLKMRYKYKQKSPPVRPGRLD
jgi:hypothetical protein